MIYWAIESIPSFFVPSSRERPNLINDIRISLTMKRDLLFRTPRKELDPTSFLAHIEVWQKIVAENTNDALCLLFQEPLEPRMIQLLNQRIKKSITLQMKEWDIWILDGIWLETYPIIGEFCEDRMYSLSSITSPTTYVIRTSVMKTLLQSIFPLHSCLGSWFSVHAQLGLLRMVGSELTTMKITLPNSNSSPQVSLYSKKSVYMKRVVKILCILLVLYLSVLITMKNTIS